MELSPCCCPTTGRETPPLWREKTSWEGGDSAETGDSPGWGQSIVGGEERK